MINSYPSIYNLGHSAVSELLHDDVIVEEKVDGSQFSFRKTEEGDIECRSKGAAINMVAPEGMFKLGVEMALANEIQLQTDNDGLERLGDYPCPCHRQLGDDYLRCITETLTRIDKS